MHPFTAMTAEKRGRPADEDDDAASEWKPDIKRQRNDTLISFTPGIKSEIFLPGTGTTSITPNTRPGIHRAHTLPFRLPSDSFPHMYSSPATPTPSEHSADSGSPSSLMSSPVFAENDDVQMNEETVSVVGSQSPTSPYQQHVWVRPAKLHPQSLYPQNQQNQVAGARIPTPIHPNFFPGMLSPAYSQPSPWEHSTAVSTSISHNYPPNHPMPSPITEDIMDDSPAYLAGTQLSRLSMNGEDGMEMDAPMTPSKLMDPPGLPPRIGRARSGAITEKKRIFMGYLEDCEKCRNRTPGHLAHFLPV